MPGAARLVTRTFQNLVAPKQMMVPSLVPMTTTPPATAGDAVIGEPDSYCQTGLPVARSST